MLVGAAMIQVADLQTNKSSLTLKWLIDSSILCDIVQ